MNRLSRYIMRQLIVGIIASTTVLAGILWLANSVKFVELLINRGLSGSTFVYLTMLTVPNLLNFVLPIAAFAVVAFIYTKLNSDRELIILRSAGFSHLGVAEPALILGIVLTAISYAFSFYLTPTSFEKFRTLQFDIRHEFSHVLLKEGEFNSLGARFTIYIRERNGDADLRGVLVHDKTDPAAPITYIAERGVLVEGKEGPRVVVFDGNRQQFDEVTKKLSVLYYDRLPIELAGIIEKPDVRYREARERSTIDLLNLKIGDLGNPSDFGKFKVEAHQRFTSPLMNLSFVIITIICLVLGDFSRQGQWRRIVLALLLNISVAISNLGLANLSAKFLELVPLMYLNAVLPILIAVGLLIYQPKFGRQQPEPALAGA